MCDGNMFCKQSELNVGKHRNKVQLYTVSHCWELKKAFVNVRCINFYTWFEAWCYIFIDCQRNKTRRWFLSRILCAVVVIFNQFLNIYNCCKYNRIGDANLQVNNQWIQYYLLIIKDFKLKHYWELFYFWIKAHSSSDDSEVNELNTHPKVISTLFLCECKCVHIPDKIGFFCLFLKFSCICTASALSDTIYNYRALLCIKSTIHNFICSWQTYLETNDEL